MVGEGWRHCCWKRDQIGEVGRMEVKREGVVKVFSDFGGASPGIHF